MVECVTDEQHGDDEQAAELDDALGGAGVRLDHAHDGARGAPSLEIGERDRAGGDDRLDRADLVAVHDARLAKRENETGAVVRDGEGGDLSRAQRLRGIGVGDARVALRRRRARSARPVTRRSAPGRSHPRSSSGRDRDASVIAENGRSFQLRRSRGRADWSFARRRAVMNYRRSALWGSTTRGSSRAVH